MSFSVGDVWVWHPRKPDGPRWRVESVDGQGRAVLQSLTTNWAKTRPVSFAEWWSEGWMREEKVGY